MHEMFVINNLLAITAVYQCGCRHLKITLHGNLSFVDAVSDSDTYGSFISNFRLFTIVNRLRFHNKIIVT